MICKVSINCVPKSPQYLKSQKTYWSKFTQSRPFSPEIYSISLQNYTISLFLAKIEPVPLISYIKLNDLFLKKNDPISPLFARSLYNLDRGHLFLAIKYRKTYKNLRPIIWPRLHTQMHVISHVAATK